MASLSNAQRPIQYTDQLIAMPAGSTLTLPSFVKMVRQVNGVNYTSSEDGFYDTKKSTEFWYATDHGGIHGARITPVGTSYHLEYGNFLYSLAELGIASIYICLARDQDQERMQVSTQLEE